MGGKKFVMALAITTCLAGPAFGASSANSSSNSTGTGTANANNAGIENSGALSNSYSGSTSASTGGDGSATGSSVVNFTYNDPSGTGAGAGTSGDPNYGINERFVTVGTAVAPSIYNNNLCALGMSAAGGFMGGAFAFGLDRVDKGCDQRATAALLGHFAEIYAIQARTAADPMVRQQAALASATYSRWAVNYLCKMDGDLASTAPPGSGFCPTVATQAGLQVVPAPVAAYIPPPAPQEPHPIVAAITDPPPKPVYTGPHVYGTHELVPSSIRNGPISGYNGPDYDDKGVKD